MITEQFDALFSAYLTGASSKDQLEQLLAIITAPENREWAAERISRQLTTDQPPNDLTSEKQLLQLSAIQKSLDENLQILFKRIDNEAGPQPSAKEPASRAGSQLMPIKGRRGFRWLTAAAAAAAIVLFAGVYWWNQQQIRPTPVVQTTQNLLDFKPGKNAAILTVDGGKQILLDSNTIGAIALQGNSSVTSINGQLQYTASRPANTMVYNTLTTSNGNQYILVLPDGTKVWLNAASSIRYPVAFNGSTREVELQGEAYLEVHHDEKQPFIVKAGGQIIEDIGTSFNVHAYADEQAFSTTLVDGIIKVAGTVLKPGTQALIRAGKLTIKEVDTSQVVAWKNGLFAFHQTSVNDVMRQIARWYDVEVEYQGDVPSMRFGGKISRNSNASVVLTILKKSGLDFKVEGRKIIINGSN